MNTNSKLKYSDADHLEGITATAGDVFKFFDLHKEPDIVAAIDRRLTFAVASQEVALAEEMADVKNFALLVERARDLCGDDLASAADEVEQLAVAILKPGKVAA